MLSCRCSGLWALPILACVMTAGTPPPVSVSVNPSQATLNVNGTKTFSANVSNTTNHSVTWYVNGVAGGNGSLGTISATGQYTAPAKVPNPNTVTVKAVSQAQTTQTASATVTLLNAVPTIGSIDISQINTGLKFSMQITGTNFLPNAVVALSDNTPVTVTSRSSTQLVVTGTSTSPAATVVHVNVVNPNPGQTTSTTKNLTVEAPITVTVSPATKTVRGLTSATFYASVTGNNNRSVTWAVNGIVGGNASVGTISTAGVYAAPAVIPATVSVSAVSLLDATKSDSATVTLENPIPVVSTATSPLTTGSNVAITVTGTGFAKAAQVLFAGSAMTVKWTSATQLVASGPVAQIPGGIAALKVVNPNPGTATSNVVPITIKNTGTALSYSAAKRFLEQASWGPTPASVAHLQTIGIDAWITEQMDASKTPTSQYAAPLDDTSNLTTLQEQFFENALAGPDQLRQRVAFALGQIAVVSEQKLPRYYQMMPYQQMLLNDAFGTYKAFMTDVTLSPAMGHYLDMVNNDVPSANYSPDENYSRESMQLFTIGLAQLNAQGAASQPPIPTYTEDDVRALARVFTGWTYPTCTGAAKWPNPPCFDEPMIAVEAHHDSTSKEFLGVNIQGGSAEADLNLAFAAIESYTPHGQTTPNIAPFVALRLIQHLVTSNPSPAYVGRIAAVYVSTSGNIGSMVRALLEDPDARSTPPAANEGHLREPVFMAVSLLRALDASTVYDPQLNSYTGNMGQDLFDSASVFNYYSPFYHVPGTAAVGPEFQILSESTAFYRVNYVYRAIRNQLSSDVTVNLANWEGLASDVNSATETGSLTTMLNAVSQALLGAPMAADMLSAIMPAMLATNNPATRVQNAVYLTAASSRYQVEQ
ncbi:MAG: DUF1800 family protein [Bryobacteraceae bacterium]